MRVDGQMVDKPGTLISPESAIIVEEDPIPFVSREVLNSKALDIFKPPVEDRVYIDVGASTGDLPTAS